MKNRLTGFGLLAMFCIAISSCAGNTEGQRLVQVEIQLDDKIAFTGKQGVSDSVPVEKIWESISDTLFGATTGYSGSVDAGSETHSLTGSVVVILRHVDRELGTSKLETLKLKKSPPSSWKLADGEMELIKQSAVTKNQRK